MRVLGALALVLTLAACGGDPDPLAGYSAAEQRWFKYSDYDPQVNKAEADASLDFAQSVCSMKDAGADAAQIYTTIQPSGAVDTHQMAEITLAIETFCP